MSSLQSLVRAALDDVIDPCSVTAGAPLSIVDMGMLLALSTDERGHVCIEMRATSAMCTVIASIMKTAEERIARVEGVTSVEVKLRSGPLWTEGEMTDKGRAALNERRRLSRSERIVKPHEWKTRVTAPRAPAVS
jgi:metal-sulfur cluster biosynthetic enzyme